MSEYTEELERNMKVQHERISGDFKDLEDSIKNLREKFENEDDLFREDNLKWSIGKLRDLYKDIAVLSKTKVLHNYACQIGGEGS